MSSFAISDTDLAPIKDQVVLVTGKKRPCPLLIPLMYNTFLTQYDLGASSGIGLATVKRLISHGAKVFATDINELPEPERSSVPFLKADVTSWKEQVQVFKAAKEKFGGVRHVFANAGMLFAFSLHILREEELGDEGRGWRLRLRLKIEGWC